MAENVKTEKPNARLEKLTSTAKFKKLVGNADLYSLPVDKVPGCGYLLGLLMKQEQICRASDLYNLYKTNKSGFTKYLACKFGPWNGIYIKTIVKAFEDWEKAHVVKPERKVKAKPAEKPKGPPRKVGPGSKKWTAFLQRPDLSKTSIRMVPGIASILGCEMEKRGYCKAQQLMDQFKGDKKGQCKANDAEFHKWILCCFGYWNTQYSKTVLDALKAYIEGHDSPNPIIQAAPIIAAGQTFGEKVAAAAVAAAEAAAEKVSESLKDDAVEVKEEGEEEEASPEA